MSNLCISPVFKEIKSIVGAQTVSSIYFGRHCGTNVLLLLHEVTLMLVFRSNDQWRPDFIKSVSSKGIAIKGTQIVGNGDILLLLDDTGRLWRLINAFELPSEQEQRLYLLDEKCFYEWVPFKKINFGKVLAVSAWGHGFICLGTHGNSEKKLVLLPSADSHFVKDYTFEEIRSSNSLHFSLTSLRSSEDSTNKNDLNLTGDTVLITDRFTGKTYLCSEDGRNSLINYSSNHFVSALHFEQENCVLLAFQNGKLVLHFLSTSANYWVMYLPKKLNLMEKCCCSVSCLLWSDGHWLHHTQLVFQCHEPYVKLYHLKLHCNIEHPSHFVKFGEDVLVVTINNIYYRVRAGPGAAQKNQRTAAELISAISKGSLTVDELNTKTDMISHFLHSKEILNRSDIKERVEMNLEQSCVMIKLCVNVVLRRDFWKVRLMVSSPERTYVKMADLEADVSEGMVIKIENPFKSKSRVKVSFVGDFGGEGLFVNLGEIGEEGSNELKNHLEQILIRRNPFCCTAKTALNRVIDIVTDF